MAANSRQQTEWADGFLFVGNQLALDFLNTKPILEGQPRELLADAAALERWLIASGLVRLRSDKALLQDRRGSRETEALVRKLIAFRERLREAVLRLEGGSLPGDRFLAEVNMLLEKHPQHIRVGRRNSKLVLGLCEPRRAEDVWAPIVTATAQLLSELDLSRIRKCESESCVVHFYDTSKKGSRRWCSMNLCGNKFKVAAYQRRRRRLA